MKRGWGEKERDRQSDRQGQREIESRGERMDKIVIIRGMMRR